MIPNKTGKEKKERVNKGELGSLERRLLIFTTFVQPKG